eukprot:9487880-Pyramimonas_sp.AAC.1
MRTENGAPKLESKIRGPKLESKATLDKESGVWKPVELHSRTGHGHHRRPRQRRNPPGSAASRTPS